MCAILVMFISLWLPVYCLITVVLTDQTALWKNKKRQRLPPASALLAVCLTAFVNTNSVCPVVHHPWPVAHALTVDTGSPSWCRYVEIPTDSESKCNFTVFSRGDWEAAQWDTSAEEWEREVPGAAYASRCVLLFLCLLSSLRSLSTVSNSYLLLLFSILFKYLLTQSFNCVLSLPHLIFPSTYWGSVLFASFPSSILSTWLSHFNLLLTNFFLKLSFTSTSTLSSCILFSSLFTPTILLILLFLQTFTFCCLSVSVIISKPYMCAKVYRLLHTCMPGYTI